MSDVKTMLWNNLGVRSMTMAEISFLVGYRITRQTVNGHLSEYFNETGASPVELRLRMNNIILKRKGSGKELGNYINVGGKRPVSIAQSRFNGNIKAGDRLEMKEMDVHGEKVWLLRKAHSHKTVEIGVYIRL